MAGAHRRRPQGRWALCPRERDSLPAVPVPTPVRRLPRQEADPSPAIEQVAVVGIPHEVRGEEVYAVVAARAGVRPDTALAAGIVAWAKERMAAYKYPREVLSVDAFALGPSGWS
ncbi:AMP-binding enzyme [Streptomyces neyagawaensis]|uniref:AMP-binding enzyme n=1 Tax=Streptomyces neyagawaensis TaxID=42238 RepID=UPI0006E43538|nr:hypothetical protein [Streptomyces neyagawaensis]MCL6731503.1 hypothetical protein [Streptomyces neyagawaensis]MDE1683059.1 hypothetical protein [Streptomyces neyagawaensis]